MNELKLLRVVFLDMLQNKDLKKDTLTKEDFKKDILAIEALKKINQIDEILKEINEVEINNKTLLENIELLQNKIDIVLLQLKK